MEAEQEDRETVILARNVIVQLGNKKFLNKNNFCHVY
jgi:hypothetical protein